MCGFVIGGNTTELLVLLLLILLRLLFLLAAVGTRSSIVKWQQWKLFREIPLLREMTLSCTTSVARSCEGRMRVG